MFSKGQFSKTILFKLELLSLFKFFLNISRNLLCFSTPVYNMCFLINSIPILPVPVPTSKTLSPSFIYFSNSQKSEGGSVPKVSSATLSKVSTVSFS
jgi:hypothetical protein